MARFVQRYVSPRQPGWDLTSNVKQHVAPGSKVFSDQLLAYFSLRAEYQHEFVNHSEAYVRGNIHTNGMENFWSLLKRGLNGTYIAWSRFTCFATSTNRRSATTIGRT